MLRYRGRTTEKLEILESLRNGVESQEDNGKIGTSWLGAVRRLGWKEEPVDRAGPEVENVVPEVEGYDVRFEVVEVEQG